LGEDFVRDRDGFSFEDTINNPLTETIAPDSVRRNNRTALRDRELFADQKKIITFKSNLYPIIYK